MSKIVVMFTGGTIASLLDPVSGGHLARLSATDVLRNTSGLEEIADVEAIDWGRVPASQFTFAQLIDIATTLRRHLARPEIEGAVVVQGTDSIEETSMAFDLLVDGPKPVVVVGSMRSPDQDGYEGAVNLRNAVRCASANELRGQGVMVVMDGEIHPADDVTKIHTSRYGAFKSPNLGPIGHVDAGGVVLARARNRRRQVATLVAAQPVHLITSVIGSDGSLIRAATEGGARGFVIAGAGVGNTPVDMLVACQEAIAKGIPVVLTTRCPAGRAQPAYSFPGAGKRWLDSGAIVAGWLRGPKARIALALGVGAGLDEVHLRLLLAD
jgi:L-asparaginase